MSGRLGVSVAASITNNGTGMHPGFASATEYRYSDISPPELILSVGMGVATITSKKAALALAAKILQIAQRMP